MSQASFTLEPDEKGAVLSLQGDWLAGSGAAGAGETAALLGAMASGTRLRLDCRELREWDSLLPAFLLRLHQHCHERGIELELGDLPRAAANLLQVASAVAPHKDSEDRTGSGLFPWSPVAALAAIGASCRDFLAFIGECSRAGWRLVLGRANTRWSDFRQFVYMAGPDAFAIITLTSTLVGMILAYLGAVQLKQFGAEIYVADLVAIGMLREMGALMTAIVMAGRTGAAYAAQLGTMQTNEEIDAIRTLGISPVEFLVMPRILALLVTMPLLTLYANVLGILGGALVAGGMGISPVQYFNEIETAMTPVQLAVGVGKSVVFGLLIAIAGCRAGIRSGRSSAAVGQAATTAVVTAIVYLIVADAAFNIIFQQLGI